MGHLPLLGWMGKGLGWATGEVFRGKRVVCLREKDEGLDVAGCGIAKTEVGGMVGSNLFQGTSAVTVCQKPTSGTRRGKKGWGCTSLGCSARGKAYLSLATN